MSKITEDPQQSTPYATWGDVLRNHGLLIFLFRGIRSLSEVGITRIWLRLGKGKWELGQSVLEWNWLQGKAFDMDYEKVKPAWQDLGVLVVLVLIVFLVVTSGSSEPKGYLAFLSVYLLADMIAYHASILWHDDLKPSYSWRRLRVWSHRRILIQGVTNFIESIFLFGVLYRYFGEVPKRPLDVYQASFDLATSLNVPYVLRDCPRWLTNFQVLFSLFFLVVLISIIASVGYTRREIAPNDDNNEQ